MDECCVVFSKGYSYQSKYQGARYYTQFMRNAAPVENQVEYSFELNAHNKNANTHHIILIDGERLANLMIEYNFCVSTRKAFEIKAIDTDALAEYQDE